MLIFDKPFGKSIKISLNSFMNGGKTRIKNVKIIMEIPSITINKDRILGNFSTFCIWLHKLQTTLDITNEHVIKRRKSFNVQIIKKLITTTENLK